jgi:hypothetical protein
MYNYISFILLANIRSIIDECMLRSNRRWVTNLVPIKKTGKIDEKTRVSKPEN